MPSWSRSPTARSTRSDRGRPASLDLGVLRAFARQTIIVGVLDLGAATESAEEVAARIRRGLEHVPAERLIPTPTAA